MICLSIGLCWVAHTFASNLYSTNSSIRSWPLSSHRPPSHIVPGAVVIAPRKQQPQPPSPSPATVARAENYDYVFRLCHVEMVPSADANSNICSRQAATTPHSKSRKPYTVVHSEQSAHRNTRYKQFPFSEGIQMSNGSMLARSFVLFFLLRLFFLLFCFSFEWEKSIHICAATFLCGFFIFNEFHFRHWVALGVASISLKIYLNDMLQWSFASVLEGFSILFVLLN